MAHIRQSRPDYGLGVQSKVLKTFQNCPSLPGSGAHALSTFASVAGLSGKADRCANRSTPFSDSSISRNSMTALLAMIFFHESTG